jgi:23S rRNA pseudouridine1911/1915/1917 synthase
MDATTEFLISPKETSCRLDLYLKKRFPMLSRSRLQGLIKRAGITVNGRSVKPSYRLRPEDRVRLDLPTYEPPKIQPQTIPLEVVYEDDSILLINKPAGMVVHPAPGHYEGTLVNALLARDPKIFKSSDGEDRPGIVHRLDKDTSGLLVVAKTESAHQVLARQFKAHTIHRIYLALALGILKPAKGRIDLAIGRDRWERKKISMRTTRPKEAVTEYRAIERFKFASLLEIKPLTGRTHQIRVHLASIKHPILGDAVYGGRKAARLGEHLIPRQMLHAHTLGFLHPVTRQPMEFSAPMPPDMEAVLTGLRRASETAQSNQQTPLPPL